MPIIRTLILRFSNEISASDIPGFRGAVIASLKQKNILYHNHDENGVVYRYPRIQYKRINRKAAIVCIQEGVDAIHELFTSGNFTYRIGEKDMEMRIESVNTYENDIDFCDTHQSYHLHNWLPLNAENYKEYQKMERYADKILFLENKLKANILSFFSSIGYYVDQQIVLNIMDIRPPILVSYKGVKLMAFDVDFNVNLLLPNYIGIGKSASIGYGTLSRIKNQ
jgi:hypothetical protein